MSSTNTSSNFCGSPDVGYVSPYTRETDARDERVMVLTPWTVQNICYEVLKNYMTANAPQDEGYRFAQKYDPDEYKSGIALQIAYHYNDAIIQKRPAVFVGRGETRFTFPTINQLIGSNPQESEKTRYSLVEMPLNVTVLATNIGFVEQLAEYVFKIFLRYQEVIRNDFCIRQFKLVGMTPPSIYNESKEHFVITIALQANFDMGAVIKGDDLKIKTISYPIFLGCAESVWQ